MRMYVQMNPDLHLGSQPDAADLELLRQKGVRTVIDLRLRSETAGANQELVAKSGLRYVNIGVDESGLNEDVVAQVTQALRSGEGPYVLHSGTGRRATAVMAISRARQNGWPLEKSLRTLRVMGSGIGQFQEFLSFLQRSVSA